MRVIKPMRLSLVQRAFCVRRRHRLAIGLMVYFPFESPQQPLPEISMWKQVMALAGETPIDEGLPKVQSELLMLGNGYAPGGTPVPAFRVRLQLSAGEATLIDKTAAAIGPRFWQHGAPSEPQPLVSLPLNWEQAFGGEGFDANPAGKGAVPIKEEGRRVHPLPQLENPKRLVASKRDRPAPMCFAPLSPELKSRMALMGTYDKRWLDEEFPGLASDLDPAFFQLAPKDQRIDGFFRGAETVHMTNLHPDEPELSTALPRLRVRCFVRRAAVVGAAGVNGAAGVDGDGGVNGAAGVDGTTDEVPASAGEPATPELEEVGTRLETVVLLPNIKRGVAIYRGVVNIAEHDGADVELLMAGIERLDEPKPLAHYQQVLAQRLDPDSGYLYALRDSDLMPAPEPGAARFDDESISDMETLLKREGRLEANARTRSQRHLDKLRLQLYILGLDPNEHLPQAMPEQPEPPTLDEMPAFVEQHRNEMDRLTREAEARRDKAVEEMRASCTAMGLDFEKLVADSKQQGGGPPTFTAAGEVRRYEELIEVGERAGAPMLELMHKLADPAFIAQLEAIEASLLTAYRAFAHWMPRAQPIDEAHQRTRREAVEEALQQQASLAGWDLTGVDLRGLDFGSADMTEALLETADLRGANLTMANLRGAVLTRANLEGAELAGAELAGANLGEVQARGTSFEGAQMTKAVLTRAQLSDALFAGAQLEQADFMDAQVTGADFTGCNAEKVLFLELDLSAATFTGAVLRKALFFRCRGERIDFQMANLEETTFLEVDFDAPAFQRINGSMMKWVSTSKAPRADFSDAELGMANFRGVDLAEASFEGARASRADFSNADLRGGRLTNLDAAGAMFMRSQLCEADLCGANLMEAVMMGARLDGARCEKANLFRANLMYARADERTSFAGSLVKYTQFFEDRQP